MSKKERPWFRKTPCEHCPFRRDVKPFLTRERGVQLALHTTNPYNSFPCHKTTVSDDEFGGEGLEMVRVEKSLECAGFLSVQVTEGKKCPEGFEPSDKAFSDSWEMEQVYEDLEDS